MKVPLDLPMRVDTQIDRACNLKRAPRPVKAFVPKQRFADSTRTIIDCSLRVERSLRLEEATLGVGLSEVWRSEPKENGHKKASHCPSRTIPLLTKEGWLRRSRRRGGRLRRNVTV